MTIPAEHARTPDDPRLTAYEAGRWYAIHGRSLPAGVTPSTRYGYWAVILPPVEEALER